jgi:MFS family permease
VVLVVVSIAQLMVVLDATIVNIALPSAQAALGFDNSQRQWVVTAYALAFGSLLLLGGRVGDIIGRKRVGARWGGAIVRGSGHRPDPAGRRWRHARASRAWHAGDDVSEPTRPR